MIQHTHALRTCSCSCSRRHPNSPATNPLEVTLLLYYLYITFTMPLLCHCVAATLSLPCHSLAPKACPAG
jgi:hypothetical protein